MSLALRRWVFLVAGAGLVAVVLLGMTGLPDFGTFDGAYGQILDSTAVAQRHATDVVSAINFDYRAFDTVGEEFILFVAAAGVAVVLRQLRSEEERTPLDEAAGGAASGTSDAVRAACLALVAPTVVIGWVIVSHGQVSPGGGFQGGVILASAAVLVYLGGRYAAFRRASPSDLLDVADAAGAASFAAVGVSAMATGAAYLTNDLPLGASAGTVDSSGTIALISFFVGVEVAAAFLLIVAELLEQLLMVREGK